MQANVKSGEMDNVHCNRDNCLTFLYKESNVWSGVTINIMQSNKVQVYTMSDIE